MQVMPLERALVIGAAALVLVIVWPCSSARFCNGVPLDYGTTGLRAYDALGNSRRDPDRPGLSDHPVLVLSPASSKCDANKQKSMPSKDASTA